MHRRGVRNNFAIRRGHCSAELLSLRRRLLQFVESLGQRAFKGVDLLDRYSILNIASTSFVQCLLFERVILLVQLDQSKWIYLILLVEDK